MHQQDTKGTKKNGFLGFHFWISKVTLDEVRIPPLRRRVPLPCLRVLGALVVSFCLIEVNLTGLHRDLDRSGTLVGCDCKAAGDITERHAVRDQPPKAL